MKPCPECSPDGTLDRDWFSENGSCLFGCGPRVDTDTGFCPRCKDHSTNEAECETCGEVWQDGFGGGPTYTRKSER